MVLPCGRSGGNCDRHRHFELPRVSDLIHTCAHCGSSSRKCSLGLGLKLIADCARRVSERFDYETSEPADMRWQLQQ